MTLTPLRVRSVGLSPLRREETPLRRHYSEVLGQNYIITESGAVEFADGVRYSSKELGHIKGISKEEMRTIHGLKKAFKGFIAGRNKLSKHSKQNKHSKQE